MPSFSDLTYSVFAQLWFVVLGDVDWWLLNHEMPNKNFIFF